PPLWAGFLALWPSSLGAVPGRLTSIVGWWGLLGGLAASARRECRPLAALAAAFVGGIYSLAEFGGSARPDSIALAMAGFALARSVRRGEVNTLSSALFALAAWTKPNVIGIGAGAVVAWSYVARTRALRTV